MMKLKYFLCAAALVLAVAGAARAQSPLIKPVYLYDKYYFGMPRGVVASVPRVGPCDGMDPNEVLCAEDGLFGGLKWSRLFFFTNGKLTRVELYSEDIQSNFSRALKTMDQRGYTLVALTNGRDETFDILGEAKGKSPQELEAAVSGFEKTAIGEARIMYTYFDTASKPDQIGGRGGWQDWADAASDDLLIGQVELSIPNYVRVTFSAPKAQLTP